MPQAGIHHSKEGALSIVVSGGDYKDLDSDGWSTQLYSGPGAFDSDDPDNRGTQALRASLRYGRPIRILRSSGAGLNGSVEGYRYDGLYDITDTPIMQVNKKGGKFELFKLDRRNGQANCSDVPTAGQLAIYTGESALLPVEWNSQQLKTRHPRYEMRRGKRYWVAVDTFGCIFVGTDVAISCILADRLFPSSILCSVAIQVRAHLASIPSTMTFGQEAQCETHLVQVKDLAFSSPVS